MKNQFRLFGSKKFFPLFITQFFGAFNDNAFKNAFLIWFTYHESQVLGLDAQVMVGVASALFILPFFLFSALAGQIADKFEKSKIVRIIKVIEVAIMFAAFFGFYLENIPLLLTLIFLMGMHSTFFGPIKYSLLPEQLKNEELISGNALIEGGTFLAILLGTIFGGVVILSSNGIEDLVIAVVIFAGIGLAASLFIPKSHISDPNLKVSFNIFSKTAEIIKHARKESSVFLAIIGISWFWFMGISFLSQFPVYTKNIINGDEYIVTLFLSIFSIGIGIGSILCNKFLKGQINGKLVPYGSMGMTFGIIVFCAASYFYKVPLIEMPHNLNWQECSHILKDGVQNIAHLKEHQAHNQILGQQFVQLIGIKDFLFAGLESWAIIGGLLLISVFAGIYIVPLYAIMQHRADQKYVSRIIAANNVSNAFFMVLASAGIIILSKLGFGLLEIFLMVGFGNILVFFVIKKVMRTRRGEATN